MPRSMMADYFVLIVLVLQLMTGLNCYGQHDSREFDFPDAFHSTAHDGAKSQFNEIRSSIITGTSKEQPVSLEDVEGWKKKLHQLLLDNPGSPIVPYVNRRLMILDWQSGTISSDAASEGLRKLSLHQDALERNFTLSMAATIDARSYDFERFASTFQEIDVTEAPQFGWFLSEYSRYFIYDFAPMSVSQEQRKTGQRFPEEYRRSTLVSDFLDERYFVAIDRYLSKSELNDRAHDANHPAFRGLREAQIVGALAQTTEYIREVLARRLYLDISERATSVLLPKSLNLWERAVDQLGADGASIEDPEWHREKIQVFRSQIVPHLISLQRGQHNLKEQSGEDAHGIGLKGNNDLWGWMLLAILGGSSLILALIFFNRKW